MKARFDQITKLQGQVTDPIALLQHVQLAFGDQGLEGHSGNRRQKRNNRPSKDTVEDSNQSSHSKRQQVASKTSDGLCGSGEAKDLATELVDVNDGEEDIHAHRATEQNFVVPDKEKIDAGPRYRT